MKNAKNLPAHSTHEVEEFPSPFGGEKLSALEQVSRILGWYVDMQEHERVGVALWVLHTHVFDRFTHTPRLSLTSPTAGFGKSTCFDIIRQLADRGRISGNTSAAALFRETNEGGTVMLDEFDQNDWQTNKTLRSVINDGYQPGRPVLRADISYNTFTPLAMAGIAPTSGTLPPAITSRSLVINMRPPLPEDAAKLKTFTPGETRFDFTRLAILKWADKKEKLERFPAMEQVLRARDNWRPLVAIADSFGKAWGKRAREAAQAFEGGGSKDTNKMLLTDIRSAFNREGDFIGSEALCASLLEANASWDWGSFDERGRTLTPIILSAMLRRIDPTLAPQHVRIGKQTPRGYHRAQFEDTWARWCPEQPKSPPVLRVVERDVWDVDEAPLTDTQRKAEANAKLRAEYEAQQAGGAS